MRIPYLRRSIGPWSGGTRLNIVAEGRGQIVAVPACKPDAERLTLTMDDIVLRKPK